MARWTTLAGTPISGDPVPGQMDVWECIAEVEADEGSPEPSPPAEHHVIRSPLSRSFAEKGMY